MLNAPAARGFRPVATCLSALIPMILIATSSFAQGDYNPKWDAFIGYQYLHPGITVPFGDPNNPLPYKVPDMTPGLGGALTYNFDPHWGAEFDGGYNWSHGNSLGTASVGPRFIWRTDGANFFAHALLSYNHLGVGGLLNGANGIGAIVGGGMDLPFSKTFSIRLFEADYVFSRHNYADYATSEEFGAGLVRLREVGRKQRCAIMCAEALWWRCHRRIIADYLVSEGETVFHILGMNDVTRAHLTTAAKRRPEGTLAYPARARSGLE